jgi:hypothetical protein
MRKISLVFLYDHKGRNTTALILCGTAENVLYSIQYMHYRRFTVCILVLLKVIVDFVTFLVNLLNFVCYSSLRKMSTLFSITFWRCRSTIKSITSFYGIKYNIC